MFNSYREQKLNCLQVLLVLYNPSKQFSYHLQKDTLWSEHKDFSHQVTSISSQLSPAQIPNSQSRPCSGSIPAPYNKHRHFVQGLKFPSVSAPLAHIATLHFCTLKPSIKSNSVHHTVNGIKNTNQKRPYCTIQQRKLLGDPRMTALNS